jgi:peptide/nickel transport system permease protein
LRSAGKTKLKTASGGTVRMRIGFTPVLDNSADPHTHARVVPLINADGATPVAREAQL